ncbi:MAG TPA: nitrous oxide reductase family maturation protein NosD [Paenalcaligenes sp.]|nr:nitrous oxide reductase family maturation protein NosD [Paenalcaligenes sp.]
MIHGIWTSKILAPALLFGSSLLASIAPASWAETISLSAGADIQQAIEQAQPGDVLQLSVGVYKGPITIDKSLSLIGPDVDANNVQAHRDLQKSFTSENIMSYESPLLTEGFDFIEKDDLGENGALIQGDGTGSVITVTADDVLIEGIEITGSGIVLPEMDSAILVRRTAHRATLLDNHIQGNLFGVYLHGANDALVKGNTIIGRQDMRLSEAGNGVTIWNSPGAIVLDNTIQHGRDGIFVKTSNDNIFAHNRFTGLRYAIHYMYTQFSQVIGNHSRGNHGAWAIMFSNHIEVKDNISDDDRDLGLLLNAANYSSITGNVVRNGGERCVFVYNANGNELQDNWFERCPVGIHFTAGSSDNEMSGNAFVNNQTQVKYVGTRFVDFAHEGRGNYWSDNPAFDLNGDGIADRPYRPNDVMDEILWTLPAAKALTNSPAVAAIRWAQAHFPAIHPGGVIDSAPLMHPEDIPAPSILPAPTKKWSARRGPIDLRSDH